MAGPPWPGGRPHAGHPGWYELDWDHVAGFLSRWDEPTEADLYLDATEPLTDNLARLGDVLVEAGSGHTRPERLAHVRIGLISDIHGNRVALEAVVADGIQRGVDRWWALGDLVAIGPEPVRTLELLVDLPLMIAIAGNTERYVLTDDRPPPSAQDVIAHPELLDTYAAVQRSFAWTCGALAAHDWLDWLRDLLPEHRMVLPDATAVLGVHATPGRDDGKGITPHRDEADLRHDLKGAEAGVVVAGHTHQPTDRRIGDIRAVNLGSVSNPITDDLRASYAILHADRHHHTIEHRRVAYDRDAFLRTVARSGHPSADYIASFQRGEQIRYPALRPGAPMHPVNETQRRFDPTGTHASKMTWPE